MSWLAALPVAVVTAALLVAPGLAAARAMGLRSIVAWGVAPTLTVASVGGAAVVAGFAGIEWSPLVALTPVFALAAVALVVTWRRSTPPPDGPQTALAATAGLAVVAVLGTVVVIRSVATPETLSQTYDAVFHYNAITAVLDTGNASPLAVGSLNAPDGGYYPAAWHAVISIVVALTGASVPMAGLVGALVVGFVVWPLSCQVLVRQVLGRSVAATAITPVVALSFIAFPWALMNFGVLWPNLLGVALLPAGLAMAATAAGLARDDAVGPVPALVIGGLAVVALGAAHPNTVFSLIALAVYPVTIGLVVAVRGLARAGRRGAARVVVASAVAGLALVVYLWVFAPIFAAQRAFNWIPFQTAPGAIGEALFYGANLREPIWVVSVAVLAGLVLAWRRRDTAWLIPAHAATALLFVVSSAVPSYWAGPLTGLWYNDPHRLAAVLPVTAVPLAVLGLVTGGAWVARSVTLPSGRTLRTVPVVATAIAVLLVTTGGLYAQNRGQIFADYYRTEGGIYITGTQQAFLTDVGSRLPEDSVVAQNPWTGSAFLYTLTGREVVFPHVGGEWTAEQLYLARRLDGAADDPRACEITRELGVDHVLRGPIHVLPEDDRFDDYPGIENVAGAPGFELVAADGEGFELYRITACERPRQQQLAEHVADE